MTACIGMGIDVHAYWQTKDASADLMNVTRHVGRQADSGAWLELSALHRLHHLLISCLHDSVLTQVQSAHPLQCTVRDTTPAPLVS